MCQRQSGVDTGSEEALCSSRPVAPLVLCLGAGGRGRDRQPCVSEAHVVSRITAGPLQSLPFSNSTGK